MDHTLDAKGRTLGRVASEAALILLGKNSPTYRKDRIAGNTVIIQNASKIKIDPRKRNTKEYSRYSGYPGGLKKETMDEVLAKKGIEEVLKKTIRGMLPANKLRPQLLKSIRIEK